MPKPISLNLLFKHPCLILATGFASGLSPKAPGTFGTLAAIPVYLLVSQFNASLYIISVLLMFVVGILLCNKATEILQVHDHPGIVWDEFVGYLITMFMVPGNFTFIVLGFFLFRFFDILKPWPIKYLDQQVKGGFGIMIDDVLAGVMANIVLQIIIIGFF